VRAIVFDGAKASVADGVEVKDPGPGEVKVQVTNAGLCHSDVSVLDGTIPWPSPSVLGHEGAGIVAEVGPGVSSVKPGQHVVLSTLANCGICKACNTGHPTWCRKSLGNMSQPFTVDGEPAWNFAGSSYFSEYTVVQEVQAIRIPDDVPLSSACLIGCGVLTGAGAALNRAKIQQGEPVAVFGVGGVGLNAIQGARIAGAGRIIAVDTVAAKEPHARTFGATDFVDASGDTDVVQAIKDLTRSGVMWAFDCVGHPAVLRNAVDVLDWGGNAVIIGMPPPTVEASFNITNLNYIDRGILGCRYGSSRPRSDVPMLVELYRSGRLLLDELVSEQYPLDRFEAVVEDLHAGKLARGVLNVSE
jgi:S-(hydroxymethyl)glutathione dehydrogenase/alcohol dehydrogenase